jgi:purine-binding chemotaxis protein CheW
MLTADFLAFVVFALGDDELGIPVERVGGVLPMKELAPVPGARCYFRGMMKLEDQNIPVLDPAATFGLPQTAFTERTCIIVAEVLAGEEAVLVGVITEDLPVVVNVEADQIRAAAAGSKLESCALGVAEVDGRVKTLLDIDKAFNVSDLFQAPKVVN